MKDLTEEELALIKEKCEDCVKLRWNMEGGTYCLVLSEFWWLDKLSRKCPARETNLLAWKRTLIDMVEYNVEKKYTPGTEWVVEELKKLEKKMSSEIDQCRFENEHKSIKGGKSESGRDKNYKRRRGKRRELGDGYFPDFER